MSWDSYIDNLLGHSKESADKACIIGQDGSKWTSDAHPNSLKITTGEAAAIGAALKSGDMLNFQSKGVHLEGCKYQFLRAEDTLVLGKKKDLGAISMQKSKTAVVIAHTKEGGQQGDTNKAVGVIAEYLESLGM